MNRIIFLLVLLLILACASQPLSAAATPEVTAVKARVASYVEAFNRRDLDACIEHWSETAEYVLSNSGQRVEGRKAIREVLEELLKTDEAFDLSVAGQRFRPVSRDVVIEEGTASLVSASHGFEQASYLVVHVKQNGKWYRDSVRKTAVAATQASSRIEELAWLIGQWQRKDDHGSVRLQADWMKNRRFISVSFEIRGGDEFERDGKQVIGWDPLAGVIRSWTFDSQGGFEEAVWTQDEKRWLVKVSAVLPDGSTGSEQRILTRVDDASFTQEVVEQQVNGRLMPGAEKATLTRVPQGDISSSSNKLSRTR